MNLELALFVSTRAYVEVIADLAHAHLKGWAGDAI